MPTIKHYAQNVTEHKRLVYISTCLQGIPRHYKLTPDESQEVREIYRKLQERITRKEGN